MSSTNQAALRPIAEDQLAATFADLGPDTKQDLATSLVRQWLTYDRTAVLLTCQVIFWFSVRQADGAHTQVVRDVARNVFAERMRRSGIAEEAIPALLHELNLCQCAVCDASDGQTLCLSVDPAKREFMIQMVENDDEERNGSRHSDT